MTFQSAASIAINVRKGSLDPVAVVSDALDRAAAAQERLNAFTIIDRAKALAQVERLQARLAADADLPLAGVPLIVKDNIWVGGWRISQGSRTFADHIAPRDAISVARARAAGAIVIAIGTCSEFACKGLTNTPFYGVTHHPMDADLTPGGSSGGNAAALAVGVTPLALGTDAGGSSRRPPAHCGIVGFKPSYGAIPHPYGFPEPFWGITCISPMARTVADAALLFEVISGPDAADPESRALAPAEGERRLRIGMEAMLGLDAPVDDDALSAFEAAAAALKAMDHDFAPRAPDWPSPAVLARLMDLQHAGLAAIHGAAWRRAPEIIDPDVGAQIERGLTLTGPDVAAAVEASREVRLSAAAFFSGHDLMISLTAPCVAWPHQQLGPPEIGGQPVGPRGHAVLTPLWNQAQCPAISIPCGRGRNGLPIGLQIAGPVGSDRRVLAFAAKAEKALAEAGLWSTP